MSAELLFTLTTFVVFAFAGLFALVLYAIREVRRYTGPTYRESVRRAREEADQIIDHARASSNKMLAEARTETAAAAAEWRAAMDALFREHMATFDRVAGQDERDVKTYTDHVGEAYAHMDAELQGEAARREERVREGLSAFSEAVQNAETEMIARIKAQIDARLTQALDSAERAIAAYRQQRMSAIESQIVTLVERTTALALPHALSPREHAGIILDALARAKEEGVFTES